MTTKHTPGPWVHDTRGYPHPDVRSASGRKVACTWGVNNQPKTREAAEAQKQIARANARRIVACVNACEGLHTESLERGKPLADQIVDALNLRDELLEVLQSFLRAPSTGSSGPGAITIAVQEFNLRAARAAIAKAQGEKA